MSVPVLALERVTLRYATAAAPTLTDITLRVTAGEFLGIVGSTGSGKSSLLYLLAGVIPHYVRAEVTGDVLLLGRPTRELSLARVTEKVGLVLQDPEAQLFNLFVRDELAWGLENRGLAREDMALRIASTLAFFGIDMLRERITYDLSGGEKQRIALAAVHAMAPDIYLFDHPTSQLDPIGAAQVIAKTRSTSWWSTRTGWRSWIGAGSLSMPARVSSAVARTCWRQPASGPRRSPSWPMA
jgi:energy-coupling factor transporter ATP-binding protein EcfA2